MVLQVYTLWFLRHFGGLNSLVTSLMLQVPHSVTSQKVSCTRWLNLNQTAYLFLCKQLGCRVIAIRWTPNHFHMIINICGESVDKFGVLWTCRWQVFFLFCWPLWRTLKIKLTYFQAMMSGWHTFTYVSTLVQFSFLSFGVFTAWAEGWWQEKRCFDAWHSSWLQSNLIIK
jgi:hypothetical protein